MHVPVCGENKKEEKGLGCTLGRFAMLEQANTEEARKVVPGKGRSGMHLLSSVEHRVLSHSFVFT